MAGAGASCSTWFNQHFRSDWVLGYCCICMGCIEDAGVAEVSDLHGNHTRVCRPFYGAQGD